MIRTAIHMLIANIPCLAFAGLTYLFAKSGMNGFAVAMVILAFLSLHTIQREN